MQRKPKWLGSALLAPFLPLVPMLAFFAYPKLALPPENDVSWTWGYVREWLDAGAPLRDGWSCILVAEISNANELRMGPVPDDERQHARSRCAAYCEMHRLEGNWNPGMTKDICATRSLFE